MQAEREDDGEMGKAAFFVGWLFFVSAGEQQGEGEMGKWSGCFGWFLERKKKSKPGQKQSPGKGGVSVVVWSFRAAFVGKKKFKLGLLFWPVEVEEDGWTSGCFGEKEWRLLEKIFKSRRWGFLVCSFGREGWSRKIQTKGGAAVFAKKMGNGGVKNARGRGGCFG